MNKTDKYVRLGIGIFALIAVISFILLFVEQSKESEWLLYASVTMNLLLAFIMLFLLVQYDQEYRDILRERKILKNREEEWINEKQKALKQKEIKQEKKDFDQGKIISNIISNYINIWDDLEMYTEKILQNIAKELNIVQGVLFVLDDTDQLFHLVGKYAYMSDNVPNPFPVGESLTGQVAQDCQIQNIQNVPDGYITIMSGLGKGNPHHLLIVPVALYEGCIAVIELASFSPFGKREEDLMEGVAESIANRLNELRQRV